MDDVDRLSKGGAAKRRGTGSFHIPHRLNSDERPVYEAAKKKVCACCCMSSSRCSQSYSVYKHQAEFHGRFEPACLLNYK